MRKNKTLLIVLAVIVGLALIIGIAAVGSYNGLVSSQEAVSKQKGDIQADLQRRVELVPNLVNTVKGYAKHEETIYKSITDARNRLDNAISSDSEEEMAAANNELTSALNGLDINVIVESNPELKANQNFLELQTQLEGTENRIKVSRTRYNEAVSKYNRKVRVFPGNIFAGMFGFQAEEYFEASGAAQQSPTVSFE